MVWRCWSRTQWISNKRSRSERQGNNQMCICTSMPYLEFLYRGAFIPIPVALFLLPIGGIWAIVDIVRRKENNKETKNLLIYWLWNDRNIINYYLFNCSKSFILYTWTSLQTTTTSTMYTIVTGALISRYKPSTDRF